MTTRVSRCVQSNQTNRWLAFERDDVAVFNKTIHVNVAQHCGGFSVRRHGNSSSEMRFQRVHAANVIGMEMCDDDLAHAPALDRKSTRLNSSHSQISYAVFCLKKK